MNIVGLPALVGTYDNYIWIMHNEKNAWVVDPGESTQVIDYLKQHQLSLKAILVTHQHFDHVDGIETLVNHFPDSIVYGPSLVKHPLIQIPCKENDVIELTDKLHFTVLETPGHTKDHIAFVNDKQLFCGDTLFTAGCGRVLGGTTQQFSDSIIKLRNLPDDLDFYCAHEYTETNLMFSKIVEPGNAALISRIQDTQIHYPAMLTQPQSTLRLEKQTNPFLRFDQPELKQKLMAREASDNAESLFCTLREWKDEFDRSH